MRRRIVALVAAICFLFALPSEAMAAKSSTAAGTPQTKSASASLKKKVTTKTVKKNTKKKKKKKTKKVRKIKTVTSRDLGNTRGAARVVRYAMLLEGSSYRGGGASPNGFDCSGFTSYVFKNALGISLPHTSGGQAGKGTALAKSDLRPGDIVYFKTSSRRISHVGIYIGGGRMISSTSSSGVKVTSINDGYWGKRYLGGRRIIK